MIPDYYLGLQKIEVLQWKLDFSMFVEFLLRRLTSEKRYHIFCCI